jgi:hypothetical protein
MVRKQVYIEQAQDEKLKRLAKRRGVTEAELIRLGIESLTEGEAEVSRESHLRELRRILEERAARLPRGGGTSRWNREDLYTRW